MRRLHTVIIIALALFVLVPPTTAQQSEQPEKYLLLSTSRTGTMEEELNETPPSSLWPSSHGASWSAWRRTRSPRQGWPQSPAAARRSAEPRA